MSRVVSEVVKGREETYHRCNLRRQLAGSVLQSSIPRHELCTCDAGRIETYDVSDSSLGHDGDRNGLDNLLDHLRIRLLPRAEQR
jgi:hypothetical protein